MSNNELTLTSIKNAIKEDIKRCEKHLAELEDGNNLTAQSLYIGEKAGLELALSYVDIAIIDLIKGE